jgi:hypothetical protein
MAASDPLQIQVQNLSRFRRELKAAQPGLVQQVKEVNFKIATEVVESARSRASVVGGVAPKAASSMRAAKTSVAARVTLGGSRYPYAYGAEFGSLRYKQFHKWRGNQWQPWGDDGTGYFLHPTIRDMREQIMQEYGDAVEKIMHAAFE